MEEEKALQLYLEHYKDYLTMGLQRTLASIPGVCNIRVETGLPVDRPAIAGWEQKYAVQMPADLRSFYLATDGLRVAWDYRVSPSGDRFEIGRAEIRPLSQLTRLGGGRHGADDALTLLEPAASSSDSAPRLGGRALLFELDGCGGHGLVCLVCQRDN
ncbi:tubulin polyglutamylase complex subunit 2-like [Pollicipes pollicipes]|uniref:tubulin polyglutamylase complex subunit 2-like n=1 Tax=Pollicipes pollicipes TaxID=41117 RepID=UPI001885712E|nr:tubulin polyglutamylase complex subunit 2-like [Pollicipes pollicipes]